MNRLNQLLESMGPATEATVMEFSGTEYSFRVDFDDTEGHYIVAIRSIGEVDITKFIVFPCDIDNVISKLTSGSPK